MYHDFDQNGTDDVLYTHEYVYKVLLDSETTETMILPCGRIVMLHIQKSTLIHTITNSIHWYVKHVIGTDGVIKKM